MSHVQLLESRQLLSATFAAARLVPKPVIPNIDGKYVGTITTQKPIITPATFSFVIKVAGETEAGAFSGTQSSDGGQATAFKGTITAKDAFAFKQSIGGNRTASLTGTYQPKTHGISGKFTITAGKGKPAENGVFSVKLAK